MTEHRDTPTIPRLPRLDRRVFLQGAAVSAAVITTGALFRPAASATGDPVLRLSYDQPNGSAAILEEVSRTNFTVRTVNNPAERVPGVRGSAFRTDGFSTWATGQFTTPLTSQMTVQTWVALESYPSDAEQPYTSLTPSSIMHQRTDDSGFDLAINTFGEWWFTAHVGGQWHTVKAPWLFPLYEWVQVSAVVDGAAGELRLHLDDARGPKVARVAVPAGARFRQAAGAPLVIGKGRQDLTTGVFLVNALNAAYDDTRIYDVARGANLLTSEYAAGIAGASPAHDVALQVTDLRFADDILRPRYHAMPPANWTNEPHGLVLHDCKYHMFYQRTPNGPFKWQMHWGHLTSTDLVHWTNLPDALYPEPNDREARMGAVAGGGLTGQGSKGIWSGDVVSVDGTAHAFFTTVNFGGPYDPGITRASSSDADLVTWTKARTGVIDKNAPAHVADFRDPYLWQEGSTWHMIIGAATGGGGALEHYTTQDIQGQWTRASSPFCTIPFTSMDIGSAIWEMPVFEKIGVHQGQDKYVLVVSPIGRSVSKLAPPYTRSVYWTGTWNGSQFAPDYAQPKMLDLIHGHLSPTVARGPDGTPVAIGIVDERSSSQMQLDLGWAHTFSAPREWFLLADGRTLGQRPLAQLTTLRAGTPQTESGVAVTGEHRLAAAGNQVEIVAQVDPAATGTRYGLCLGVSPDGGEITRLYYEGGHIVIDKSRSSRNFDNEEAVLLRGAYDEAAFGKPRKFHVFVDHSVIDVFINDAAAFSNRIYPTTRGADGRSASTGLRLYSEGGTTRFTQVDVWQLQAAGPSTPS
ncbi:GH32 C-terminal domain-containing protein [Antribacter gilvus]|uniref:GH32 C-terminal domain-containing protein n=1 Tax=Antribacter gilvus TaxID=2304675 RepID=UPI000F790696|nr:GH32 C-terminal domain-containing protein [Antribacter gilvus]